MKHKLMILVAAMTLVGSSCSLIGNNKSRVVRASGSDNRSEAAVKSTITDEALAGEWVILNVNGNELPQEDQMPYLTLEPGEHRFYASNGCNSINGDYKLAAGDKLELSSVLSTMRYCPDVPYEAEITALLGGSLKPTVSIRRRGNDSYLTLTDGGLTLTAVRHNMGFLNGQWQIIQVAGKALDDEEANLFIDIPELKVHGNTGCNYFNGTIYINPSATNAVEFSGMGLTRMACPKADQEHAIMLALEQTVTAIKGDNGRVMLLNTSGSPVMVLRQGNSTDD